MYLYNALRFLIVLGQSCLAACPPLVILVRRPPLVILARRPLLVLLLFRLARLPLRRLPPRLRPPSLLVSRPLVLG